MMIYSVIGDANGKNGIFCNPDASRIIYYLSFDRGYGPPAKIRSEIERAVNMGLIEIDDLTSEVRYTEKGAVMIEELEITNASFINIKIRKAEELEEKGMEGKARMLRTSAGNENIIWTGPGEWGLGFNREKKFSKPSRKRKVKTVGNIKIRGAPPRPVKRE